LKVEMRQKLPPQLRHITSALREEMQHNAFVSILDVVDVPEIAR